MNQSEARTTSARTGFRRGVFLLFIGILLVAMFAVVAALRAQTVALRWVAHTREVQARIEGTASALKDAETGQRGYLLTGDPQVLEPYRGALAKLPSLLDELAKLTADNPVQQATLARVRSEVHDKLSELAQTVALHDAGQADAALAQGEHIDRVFRIINQDTRATVESPPDKVLREGRTVGLANHTLLVAKDGTERPVEDSGAPIRGKDGSITGVVLVFRDASERYAAARALSDNEEQRRLATEAAEVGLWDVDIATDTLFWPPRVKAMFGISADVAVSMADFYGGLHPEDREATGAAFAAALDPNKRALYDVEYRTVGKEDGVIRWVAAKGRGLFRNGQCVRVIGTAIDVTTRKAIEKIEVLPKPYEMAALEVALRAALGRQEPHA